MNNSNNNISNNNNSNSDQTISFNNNLSNSGSNIPSNESKNFNTISVDQNTSLIDQSSPVISNPDMKQKISNAIDDFENENEFATSANVSEEFDVEKDSEKQTRNVAFENLSKKSIQALDQNVSQNNNFNIIKSDDDIFTSNSSSSDDDDESFSTKSSSDSDEEIDFAALGAPVEEEFNIFAGNQIKNVEEEIYLNEKQRIYEDDLLYIKEIENQLLGALPVTKQGIYSVQVNIQKETQEIIELKHIGEHKYNNIINNIQYNYNNNWIVPIVLDKHKIFEKIDDVNNIDNNLPPNKESNDTVPISDSNNRAQFSETKEDDRGILLVNQKIQFKDIKDITHLANTNKISYLKYIKSIHDIETPYQTKYDNPLETSSPTPVNDDPLSEEKTPDINNNVGFLYSYIDGKYVIRYYDLYDIHWNSRNTKNEIFTYTDIYDDNHHIQGTKQTTLLKSEEINVVGFMVLPNGSKDVLNAYTKDIYTPSNYSADYLQKPFVKVGDIEKIYSNDKYILIQITNHGLKGDNNRIIIENSNSYPNINGAYQKSVIVIDENTLAIDNNKRQIKIIRDGDKGVLYCLQKLCYDYFKVTLDDKNNIDTQFINTSYNTEEDYGYPHIQLYLFDDIKIDNENSFQNIIKKIAPSITQIIDNELDNLNKCDTFYDMQLVFDKYNIKIEDMNINDIMVLKKILEDNLLKAETSAANLNKLNIPVLNFHVFNKSLFSNPSNFFADVYIISPFIQKYYGKYISFNKPEDCILSRLQWITGQLDYGNLYINYVLYENLDNFEDNQDIDNIKDMKKVLETNIEDYKTLLSKEESLNRKKNNKKRKNCKLYHFEVLSLPKGSKISTDDKTGVVKVGSDTIYYIHENNVFELDDVIYIWKDGKKEEFNDLTQGTMALVDDKIFIWNQNDKKWILSEETPKYNNIRYLCEFGDINIDDIDLDSLDCIYRDQTGCQSRLIARLQEKIEFLEESNMNMDQLIEYLKENKYKKNIEDNINKAIYKYFSKDEISLKNINKMNKNKNKSTDLYNENSKNNSDTKNNNDESTLVLTKSEYDEDFDILIQKISRIQNDDLKRSFIYNIIDRDGILIDRDIYSKKFQKKIMCGHWMYLKRINSANEVNNRYKLWDELMSAFGDGAQVDHNMISCTNCGGDIHIVEYDETEGFAESGQLKMSREIMLMDEKAEKEGYKTDIDKILDCGESSFKDILMDKGGLSIDDTDNAIKLCNFIMKDLTSKTGVKIYSNELIQIIVDSLEKIKNIYPYSVFEEISIRQLKDKGFTDKKIMAKKEAGDFLRQYQLHLVLSRASIIASRFLITVQTMIPPPKRSSIGTIGTFKSFDGEDGVQYMSSVLFEMKIVEFTGSESQDPLTRIKKYVEDNYFKFKSVPYIRDLFRKKNEYLKEVSKKIILIQDIKNASSSDLDKYKESNPLPSDFVSQVKSAKNIDKLYQLERQLYRRVLYVSQEIRKIIFTVISTDKDVQDTIDSLYEKACCFESIQSYTDYFDYIQKHYNGDQSIYELIDESKLLMNFTELFMNNGVYSRMLFQDPERYTFMLNPIICGDMTQLSKDIIQKKFEYYVFGGKFSGLPREYIGNGDDAKDVRSGLTKKEILEKEYTIEEYQLLLMEIQNRNTFIHNLQKEKELQEQKQIEYDNKYDEIKKDSEKNLFDTINKFVDVLAQVLNKKDDVKFKQKYSDLIFNLGKFKYLYIDPDFHDDYLDIKQNIKYNESITSNSSLNLNTPNNNIINEQMEKEKKRNQIIRDLRLNEYRTIYIKKVFNQYFRTFLSIIKHGDNKTIDIPQIEFTSEDISKEIQEEIRLYYDRFTKFINPEVSLFFQDIFFDYSANEINDIIGKNDIYNCQYTTIKEISTLNFSNVNDILTYLLIKQLQKFILCVNLEKKEAKDLEKDENEKEIEDDIYKIDIYSKKCKYICEFIITVFDIVLEDMYYTDDCFIELKKFKNFMIYEIIDYRSKQIEKEEKDEDNYFAKMMNIGFAKEGSSIRIGELENEIDNEQNEVDQVMKDQDSLDYYMNVGRKEFVQNEGREPTETELLDYAQSRRDQALQDAKLDAEAYAIANYAQHEDVLDGDYKGEFEDDGDVIYAE